MKRIKSLALICASALAALTFVRCGDDPVPDALTYSIGASSLTSFGSLEEGYTAPAAQTVTITNTGTGALTLTGPTATDYTIGTLSTTELAAGATATFTVQPKAGLAEGDHNETIIISGSNNAKATVSARFTVTAASGGDTKSIALSAQKNAITEGVGADANYDLSTQDLNIDNSLLFVANATTIWYDTAEGGTPLSGAPEGVAGYNYVSETDSEGVFSVKLGPTISAGEYYFAVTYEGATSNRATLTVSPGTDGSDGYVIGEYWPDSTNPEGIVFWVKPGTDGAEGKVVGLGETYVAKWGPDNDEEAAGVTGIRSFTNGAMATKSMVAKYKGSATFSTDYPGFYHIYNTVNGGDADGVWYLPSCDEYKMLCAGYSGKVYEDIDWMGSPMPEYNSSACVAARAAFDAKLTAKGGKAIGSSGNPFAEWYLSSTELESTISISFGFEDGSDSSDHKNLDGNIRWIREF